MSKWFKTTMRVEGIRYHLSSKVSPPVFLRVRMLKILRSLLLRILLYQTFVKKIWLPQIRKNRSRTKLIRRLWRVKWSSVLLTTGFMSSRTFPNISLLKESGTRKQIQWWTQKGEMSLLARWQGSPISMTMKSWYQLITRLSDIKTPRKQTQWCHRCRWRVHNTSTRHWTPEPRKLSAFQSRCKRISSFGRKPSARIITGTNLLRLQAALWINRPLGAEAHKIWWILRESHITTHQSMQHQPSLIVA